MGRTKYGRMERTLLSAALDFLSGQHEREGHDFSRAIKRNQTYSALAAEGIVEERRFSAV